MIAAGGQPIGAAIGGVIAEITSIRVSFLVMALGAAASAIYAWSSALRTVDADAIARLKNDADHVPMLSGQPTG
jgi:pheromone shutdown protein TraB